MIRWQMARYELLLESEFSAAHRLRLHDGEFEPLHGHNWRVEVFMESPKLDSVGLVADFVVLQENLSRLTRELHNTTLNDHPAFNSANPSTELIAKFLHDRIAPTLPGGVRLTKVRVWETRQCAAAYVRDGAD